VSDAVPLDLAALEAEPLPPTWKGVAASAVGRPLRELRDSGLSVLAGNLPLPAAVLKESALAHNTRWMRDFTERAGASLCPHGKTTMAPQLFDRQLRAGAWGITAATAAHVRTYRRFGVPRIVLANQLIGRANIGLVLDELDADASFDFYALIDSLTGLEELCAAARERRLARPLQLLLEVGIPGGRTGVRTLEEGVALGRAVRDAAPWVVLRGVEAFEGIVGGADDARIELGVHGILESVTRLAEHGIEESWFAPGEVILSAGGSAFFDMAAAVLAVAGRSGTDVRVVLRSGCYLSHDALWYERMQARMRQRAGAAWGAGPGLRNALEVWAHVQSVPEAKRAICGLGKRDVSYDISLPQPLWWFRPGTGDRPEPAPSGLTLTSLNDQHAYLDGDGVGQLRVGDLLGFGIAHPCTTFDKWALLHLVDDDYQVVGGIRTFF
jgi:D-serine dehydratase